MRASRVHRVPAGRRLTVLLWPVLLIAIALVTALSGSDEARCPAGGGVPVPAPLSMLAHHGGEPVMARCPTSPPVRPAERRHGDLRIGREAVPRF
ncbi:hypothetical protein AGRA3207_004011 [Actinomadura graeca]|uniref:Secreted protein n=1 Tax=Actinomadura graeca TaxID=2750812 RepID=A0ABX8QVR5_9ACTN|nr:hypothetical protein [Actinomadura graeca]QXJ22930.1 hypothetical protein AGRA3207_004011 [Actinomadura graeca]